MPTHDYLCFLLVCAKQWSSNHKLPHSSACLFQFESLSACYILSWSKAIKAMKLRFDISFWDPEAADCMLLIGVLWGAEASWCACRFLSCEKHVCVHWLCCCYIGFEWFVHIFVRTISFWRTRYCVCWLLVPIFSQSSSLPQLVPFMD